MLTCLILAGSLWIGDDTRMFPTQGTYYFLKLRDSLNVYTENGRVTSFPVPKDMNAETISEVIINVCKHHNK